MFERDENPAYEKLTNDAAQIIARWATNDWSESNSEIQIA